MKRFSALIFPEKQKLFWFMLIENIKAEENQSQTSANYIKLPQIFLAWQTKTLCLHTDLSCNVNPPVKAVHSLHFRDLFTRQQKKYSKWQQPKTKKKAAKLTNGEMKQ